MINDFFNQLSISDLLVHFVAEITLPKGKAQVGVDQWHYKNIRALWAAKHNA
jgi:hypothetical protein